MWDWPIRKIFSDFVPNIFGCFDWAVTNKQFLIFSDNCFDSYEVLIHWKLVKASCIDSASKYFIRLDIIGVALEGLSLSFPAVDSESSFDIELNLGINLMRVFFGDGLDNLTWEVIFDIKVAIIPNDSRFVVSHLAMIFETIIRKVLIFCFC